MPLLSEPISCTPFVRQPYIGFSLEFTSSTLLTVSSAICLYVVHFPPVMVTMPEGDVSITCSLLMAEVPAPSFILFGSIASGRMPDHAASTSLCDTFLSRYLFDSSSMKSTSSTLGSGSIVLSVFESVVPQMVVPSQGRKKSTRPSDVSGTIRPMCSGQKWSGRMTCTPAAGTMMGFTSGLSIFLILSTKGPVAFTTARVLMVQAEPSIVSFTFTPVTFPSPSFCRPSTSM
mmetsp:Transcript_6168/g.15266  ORF Transcript_6168/g.15266 Transcript_6168/m.15266 type:complete len:231 (-) Transcript_6168:809-1501(-)